MMALRSAVPQCLRAFASPAAVGASSQIAAMLLGVPSTRSYTSSDDTHSDFKPQFNSSAPLGVRQQIEEDIRNHKVFVYMKGVPGAPLCGFSNTVCQILDAYGVPFEARNVLPDDDLRQGIKDFSDWPTIPQVYVDGEFVGGCDILMNMHQTGELEKMVLEKRLREA